MGDRWCCHGVVEGSRKEALAQPCGSPGLNNNTAEAARAGVFVCWEDELFAESTNWQHSVMEMGSTQQL